MNDNIEQKNTDLPAVGSRIIAILPMEENRIAILGGGHYEGMKPIPNFIEKSVFVSERPDGVSEEEASALYEELCNSPFASTASLKMDDGGRLSGSQVYWTDEAARDDLASKYTMIECKVIYGTDGIAVDVVDALGVSILSNEE